MSDRNKDVKRTFKQMRMYKHKIKKVNPKGMKTARRAYKLK